MNNEVQPQVMQPTLKPGERAPFSRSQFVHNLFAQGGHLAKDLMNIKQREPEKFDHLEDTGDFIQHLVTKNMPKNQGADIFSSIPTGQNILDAITNWNTNSPFANTLSNVLDWFFHFFPQDQTRNDVNNDPNPHDPSSVPPTVPDPAPAGGCPPGQEMDTVDYPGQTCRPFNVTVPPPTLVLNPGQIYRSDNVCPPGYKHGQATNNGYSWGDGVCEPDLADQAVPVGLDTSGPCPPGQTRLADGTCRVVSPTPPPPPPPPPTTCPPGRFLGPDGKCHINPSFREF